MESIISPGRDRRVIKFKLSFAPSLIHVNAVGHGRFFSFDYSEGLIQRRFYVTLHGEWPAKSNTTVGRTVGNG